MDGRLPGLDFTNITDSNLPAGKENSQKKGYFCQNRVLTAGKTTIPLRLPFAVNLLLTQNQSKTNGTKNLFQDKRLLQSKILL